jgi:proteasome lid subunit RPN8/RPN11
MAVKKKKRGRKKYAKSAARKKHAKHAVTKKRAVPELRDIFIENRAFKTLITSAIEVYNRETNGVMLGSNTMKEIKGGKARVVSIKEVYPFQTEERKPSEVVHGNVAAFRRVLRTISSFESEIVGGYHSHPHPYKYVRLSKADVESISEDIDAMAEAGQERVKKGWIEVLLSIKRKDYARAKGREWYICDYIKRLRCHVRTRAKVGYDILLSAYWVYPKPNPSGKPAKKTEFAIKEVGVYVPWNLD